MSRRLYDLTPVCSLVGLAASTLDDATFEQLRKLAAEPPQKLDGALAMASIFVGDLGDLPLDTAERRRLWDRFGAYGLHTACAAIRDGMEAAGPLRAQLLADSGMDALRAKLVDHFGHRSALLKFGAALDRITSMPHSLAAGLGPRERAALDEAIGVFKGVGLNEPGFDQLKVLRNLYLGKLGFGGDDTTELRRVLGEFGRRPADRLALAEDAPAGALLETATQRHTRWLIRWQSGVFSGADREAARVVVRAYEHLLDELRS